MRFSPHHESRSTHNAPDNNETNIIDLSVRGSVATGLSGRYVHIGEGMVEAVSLNEGHAASYRSRQIAVNATNVVAFGSSVFAFGDGTQAFELGADLDTLQVVDLAGGRRTVTADPKVDPITGELHLLTSTRDPSQLHVRVSPGGLTRTVRPIDDAPSRIRQLDITRDHVVLVADRFVGLTDRTSSAARTRWFRIDTDGRRIAAAHEQGDTVVVYLTGPSLVRWTLQGRPATAHSHLLDAAPCISASSNRRPPGAAHRFLWTVGSGAVHKHDLLAGTRLSHNFASGRHAGPHVFVADPDRGPAEDAGWVVGFVHDETTRETDFVVLDALAIERPAVAVAHIPTRTPSDGHSAWIPTAQI